MMNSFSLKSQIYYLINNNLKNSFKMNKNQMKKIKKINQKIMPNNNNNKRKIEI